MKHTLVTFIADIDASQRSQLDQTLAALEENPAQNPSLPFGRMDSIHYASFSIFRNELGKPQDTLVFEINGDGDVEKLLGELWAQGQDGLAAVFRCCEGYGAGAKNFAQMRELLLEKRQKAAAWHIGNVGMSVTRIRNEQQLCLDIEAHLDALRAQNQIPPSEPAIFAEIVRFARQKHPWALKNEPRQSWSEKLAPFWLPAALILAILALLFRTWRVTIPGALIGLKLFQRAVNRHEMQESQETPPRLDPARQAAQEAAEYAQGQNHVSSLIRVYPSPFRRLLLRFVLFVVNMVARFSTRGSLAGIPSIHFAHWSLVDNGKRLLFLSNFDNSWGSYLDDFTDKANIGLTAVWTNTRWFPPTHSLLNDGASAGARFKNWVRLSQEPVRVWYRAYPHLSAPNIERNSKIRQGLRSNLQGSKLSDWLLLF